MDTVIAINQDQMGHGDAELGRKILAIFLRKLPSMDGVTEIVFWNTGVKLVTADSPVLAELQALEKAGIDLLPCGTCLEHFGLEVAVGKASDMGSIVRELGRAGKVITL